MVGGGEGLGEGGSGGGKGERGKYPEVPHNVCSGGYENAGLRPLWGTLEVLVREGSTVFIVNVFVL